MQPLSDPKNDRVVKKHVPPPNRPLNSYLLWEDTHKPGNLTR